LIAAGSYDQIPVSRRISGPGAIVAIGPFAHASPAWPSRFTDGRYGVWHGGETFEVALMETAFHFERFMRDTWQPAGARDFFELTTKVAGTLHDLSVGFEACLNPDDYSVSQALAKRLRAENSDGIVCPSVRWPRGRACALFYPDLVKLPVVVGRQLRYRWDGERMTDYLVWGQPDWTSLPVL
jgi:hypothetical protein